MKKNSSRHPRRSPGCFRCSPGCRRTGQRPWRPARRTHDGAVLTPTANGVVTLEDISAHRLSMFEAVDTDKSGSLSRTSSRRLATSARNMRQANREERRAERDARKGDMKGKHGDRDGRRPAGMTASARQGPRRRPGRQARRHGWMERLDADKNGEISLEEFTSVDARMFERFDRNGDNKIDITDSTASAPTTSDPTGSFGQQSQAGAPSGLVFHVWGAIS